MTVLAVVLFGSRARGDQTPTSDTDLLFVTSEPSGRHTAKGRLSISLYDLPDLEHRARDGDLFLCHVLQEGQILYDHASVMPTLKDRFRLRRSYAAEIQRATDLGWLLVKFGRVRRARRLAARKMAWCVRTILIARTAEEGSPVFSIDALAAGIPDSDLVRRLVSGKDRPATASAFEDLRTFLTSRGLQDPCRSALAPGAYRKQFADTSNGVGLAFLDWSEKPQQPYG